MAWFGVKHERFRQFIHWGGFILFPPDLQGKPVGALANWESMTWKNS